jgi:NADPH-dependent 2,4-dienoyl-CoA reductase/sulfur reductase-like enzyme
MIAADIPDETDVVVVGSGAAGLVCALVAAAGGHCHRNEPPTGRGPL